MTLDTNLINQVVRDEFNNLPHPEVPEITNGEYASYARVAAMKRNPDDATPHDVRDAYHELNAAGISPSQWERLWEIARPLANRLVHRDPSLPEMTHLLDAHPADIHDYYHHLPSPSHPEIKAGVMAKYLHMSNDVANQHLERPPLLEEVARFAASDFNPDDIETHYQRMKQERG